MNWTVPGSIYLTCGKGVADYSLTAFDLALLDAGIGDYNHIKVSSVLPPGAQVYEASAKQASDLFVHGTLVPTVWAENRGFGIETIAVAITVAIPSRAGSSGMIFEEHNAGSAEDAETNTLAMAREGMEIRGEPVLKFITISVDLRIPYNQFGCVVAAAVMGP